MVANEEKRQFHTGLQLTSLPETSVLLPSKQSSPKTCVCVCVHTREYVHMYTRVCRKNGCFVKTQFGSLSFLLLLFHFFVCLPALVWLFYGKDFF